MLMNLFSVIRSRVNQLKAENRRLHRRYERVTLLTIQPLDHDFSPQGNPIWGMSRNISAGGIGFTCQRMIEASYLCVTINEDSSSMIGIIRHIQLVCEESNTYFIGLEFRDGVHYGG